MGIRMKFLYQLYIFSISFNLKDLCDLIKQILNNVTNTKQFSRITEKVVCYVCHYYHGIIVTLRISINPHTLK